MKVKVSKKELARAQSEWILDGGPDFIELEGEAVEKQINTTMEEDGCPLGHFKGCVNKPYHGEICEEYRDRGVCRHNYKELPPLPEELALEDKNLTTRVETINAIIRYLKARE